MRLKFTCIMSSLYFLKTLKHVHEDFRTNYLKTSISVSGDRNMPVSRSNVITNFSRATKWYL